MPCFTLPSCLGLIKCHSFLPSNHPPQMQSQAQQEAPNTLGSATAAQMPASPFHALLSFLLPASYSMQSQAQQEAPNTLGSATAAQMPASAFHALLTFLLPASFSMQSQAQQEAPNTLGSATAAHASTLSALMAQQQQRVRSSLLRVHSGIPPSLKAVVNTGAFGLQVLHKNTKYKKAYKKEKAFDLWWWRLTALRANASPFP